VIADDEELRPLGIPDDKREVTEKVHGEIVAPLFVGSQNEVGIGVERVLDSTRKYSAEVVPVVDAGIGRQPDVSMRVTGRLELSFCFERRRKLGVDQHDFTQFKLGEGVSPSGRDPALEIFDLLGFGRAVPLGDDTEAAHRSRLARAEPGKLEFKTSEALSNVSRLVERNAIDLDPRMCRQPVAGRHVCPENDNGIDTPSSKQKPRRE
jgi:hypothetical protein